MSDPDEAGHAGHQEGEERAAYTCPTCGGPLWRGEGEGGTLRFQCYLGHAFTGEALLQEEDAQLRTALWFCVRHLSDQASLRRQMARVAWQTDNGEAAGRWEAQARAFDDHALALQKLLGRLGGEELGATGQE